MKAIDLFCGCGGMSLGFQNAGIDVAAAFDNWDPALTIYNNNFSHKAYKQDLYAEDTMEILSTYSPDLIFGGPPCQDFSIAGKRNIGKRGNLTIRFAEIVSTLKPTWFVMENVYNIERMPVLPKAKEILKNAGYGLTVRVLNASYCGVPQARQRFFMIGHLGDKDGFLDEILTMHLSESPMTVRDYLGDSLGMVERQKTKYGWEFLFLGANIDAITTASRFGIQADRAVNYENDSEGTRLNCEVLSETVTCFRQSESPTSAIPVNWKNGIEADYAARHRR